MFNGNRVCGNSIAPINGKIGNVVGIRTSEFKYFRSRKNPKENIHLYNLKNDPLEEINLIKTNSKIAQKMDLYVICTDRNSQAPGFDYPAYEENASLGYRVDYALGNFT